MKKVKESKSIAGARIFAAGILFLIMHVEGMAEESDFLIDSFESSESFDSYEINLMSSFGTGDSRKSGKNGGGWSGQDYR